MAKVFISHSSRDQQFADDFDIELRRNNHQPLGVVPDWDVALQHALAGADVVVFLLTANPTGSENILAEVGGAKILYQQRGIPQLIPVVFPTGALPIPLARVPAHKLTTMPTPSQLGEKISGVLGGLAFTRPAPERVLQQTKATLAGLVPCRPATWLRTSTTR